VEISAAGHCPFIEQPDRFNAVVLDFLAGTSVAE
jgi:pimeloyl-ACP methyl ester carboxylesterase